MQVIKNVHTFLGDYWFKTKCCITRPYNFLIFMLAELCLKAVVLCQKRTFGNTTAQLTSPSSPASAEVTAKSFPFASYAFISMPQLVSGCLNHTESTCFTSILCQDVTPALTSIFRDRIRMCLPPSVTGISRDICKKTVVASSAGLRWTQSCALTIRFAWIFGLKEKKQHFGFRSTWTMGSAEKQRRESKSEWLYGILLAY